ncbi:hypothetical protein SG34_018635 [Thalassomonas viridans]|uniref:SPOR domain-containing protein n=1 Tax=Thalassomonas viridans TaxID=137584 RepID=A0AAF0C811_9GAMM|nr:hypothetical protein [Thalassomonas viridans]WDE03404.1 hypothetical protein SG34_018635 [Thalassomonas viridans]
MTLNKRIALGAIGGITPYLVTLLSIDFKTAVASYEVLDWIGLLVRCIVLIFLGAFVAYLHKTENEPFKVFQLGLAAPALLATFINGGVGNNETLPISAMNGQHSFAIFSKAYAGEPPKDNNGKKQYQNERMLKNAEVSGWSRFLRGLAGTKLQTSQQNSYFVIVGSHDTYKQAKAQTIRLAKKNYKAKVYNPHGFSKHYAVAIASHISKKAAIKLRDKAIADGLPANSYIWSYGK